jgi:alginate O-acetyltransferase complex protein AlgI
MVFSSSVFLFLFLPIFLLLYYAIPFRLRSAFILLASYCFYAWWRLDFVILFFAVTLWSYLASQAILRAQQGEQLQLAKRLLAMAIIGNLAVLGYFKYFNFGVDSLNGLLSSVGMTPFEGWRVILPIGISFYIFQAISYLVDVYRKDAPPAQSFWDFSAFIALFPQLIAGPILRYKDLADQFIQRTHSVENFAEGSMRFMVGFCKKVLIADTVAVLADLCFALDSPSMADAWLGAIAYTIQLYFDFSGYSDMAIGLGLMMGFRFMENFNHPYISQSITEFWRRWHISLSSWLKDYLYIPLGGNRKGQRRTYINLMVTMLLGGLWHGAAWTFVIWGGWHGSLLALERWFKSRGVQRLLPIWLAMPGTLLLVIIGWIMFRASSVSTALSFYAAMFNINHVPLSEAIAWQITGLQLTVLLLAVVLIFVAPIWRNFLQDLNVSHRVLLSHIHLLIIPLFILGIFRLIAQSYSPFLYFQF